jgi:CIC family chloride channel protein
MFRVGNVMRPPDDPRGPPPDEVAAALEDGLGIAASATLETAMPMFERTNRTFLPVVRAGAPDEPPEVLGILHQVDALKAYNRALAATAAEEHS